MSNRQKKFAWLPTKVYSTRYYQEGFKWLSYVYMEDGKAYVDKAAFDPQLMQEGINEIFNQELAQYCPIEQDK